METKGDDINVNKSTECLKWSPNGSETDVKGFVFIYLIQILFIGCLCMNCMLRFYCFVHVFVVLYQSQVYFL